MPGEVEENFTSVAKGDVVIGHNRRARGLSGNKTNVSALG